MREFEFIDIVKEKFGGDFDGLAQGIGDDCAHLLPIHSGVQLVTTDVLTHGVHFSERYSSWEDIGFRCMAVNLSDLAASGVNPERPVFIFLSLSIPLEMPKDNLMLFLEGIQQCSDNYRFKIAGGDSTGTDGPFSVSVTAIGSTNYPITRKGGVPGDLLCVCGFLGKAGTGLELLETGKKADDRDTIIEAYTRPKPLLSVGYALAGTGAAKAMIDISDGLIADAGHLASYCECDILIDIDKLPVPQAAIKALGREKALNLAAGFGDDYALLFAMPSDMYDQTEKEVIRCGSTLACIGEFVEGKGKARATLDGEPFTVSKYGYQHTLGR